MNELNYGTPKDSSGLTEKEFLEHYNASTFNRPSVTVDMLIFTIGSEADENYRKLPRKNLQLLLVKRGEHPFLGQWALPGGFVGISESLEEAARRELKSETNLESIYMEQLFTWGDVPRDPRTRVISTSWMTLVDRARLEVRAGDDAAEAAWFNVSCRTVATEKTITETGFIKKRTMEIRLWNEAVTLNVQVAVERVVDDRDVSEHAWILDGGSIAFDHALMIEYAIRRLRNKLEYTDIVFRLMPERFTLSELQQVHEVIMDREYLAAAFRRTMAGRLVETDLFTRDAGHRPSRLYKYNYEWLDVD